MNYLGRIWNGNEGSSHFHPLTMPMVTQTLIYIFWIAIGTRLFFVRDCICCMTKTATRMLKNSLTVALIDFDIDTSIELVKIRNQCIPGYTPDEIDIRCEKAHRVNALTVLRSKHRADVFVKSAAVSTRT
jgi:hypothetical protein